VNFHSYEFALFFAIVYAAYLSLSHRWQNRLLLAASYLFYSFWDPRFLGLILLSTATDFFCGRAMTAHSKGSVARRRFLLLSLGVNLSVLFFFKYFNFFLDNLNGLAGLFGLGLHLPTWRIILPVGISFYTFQSLSYTIDVYRGQMEPVESFPDYALYVAFFPQLVAGPIERATRLLPQIAAPRTLPSGYLAEGTFLIFWGLFKKIFIADNLAALLAYVGDPAGAGGGAGGMVLATTYAFMFQLYADFSAYSDIARGTARLMGFDIMVNFRSPLFAPNIQETWNRWHISLTSWIRDYLYFPLALSKWGRVRLDVRVVVILTFLIMGLWHGAAWGFVLWGGFNGLLLAGYGTISPALRRWKKRIDAPEPVQRLGFAASVVLTFHCMVLGALLFRGESLGQIGEWLRLLFTDFGWTAWTSQILLRSFAYAAPLLVVDLILYRHENVTGLFQFPRPMRYAFLYLALFLMVVFHAPASNFIYFQF